jgi:hypothetical protein
MNSLCSIYCLAANQSDPDQDPCRVMPLPRSPSFETFSSVQKKVCEWMLRVWSREAEKQRSRRKRCKRKRKNNLLLTERQDAFSRMSQILFPPFPWLVYLPVVGSDKGYPNLCAGVVCWVCFEWWMGSFVLAETFVDNLWYFFGLGIGFSGDGGEWRICMHSGGVKVVGGVVAWSF